MQCRIDSVTMISIIIPNVLSFLTDGDDGNDVFDSDEWDGDGNHGDQDESSDEEDNDKISDEEDNNNDMRKMRWRMRMRMVKATADNKED